MNPVGVLICHFMKFRSASTPYTAQLCRYTVYSTALPVHRIQHSTASTLYSNTPQLPDKLQLYQYRMRYRSLKNKIEDVIGSHDTRSRVFRHGEKLERTSAETEMRHGHTVWDFFYLSPTSQVSSRFVSLACSKLNAPLLVKLTYFPHFKLN